MAKVYKLVMVTEDLLHSYAFSLCEKSCVIYEVGQWVKPKLWGSYLMAFNTLEQAIVYRGGQGGVRIYEAEAEGEVKPLCEIPSPWDEYVEPFWKLFNAGAEMNSENYFASPDGTVWCKQLMLTNMVRDILRDND